MLFVTAFSGCPNTGATTLVGLDSLPHATFTSDAAMVWGMGIIVLAVAILPILGVGLQLYRAEMPGPPG